MARTRKSFQDIIKLLNGFFRSEVPTIDPTIKASLARGSVVSAAAATVSLDDGIDDALRQSFWQDADGEFLEKIGEYDKVFRFDPQISSGQAAATGVLGTPIPQDTPLIANGNSYIVTQDSIVQEFSGDISLSYELGIVTAVTTIPHTLSTGLQVTISGAVQADYNGTFEIIALDENTFTYNLIASLTTDSGVYSSEYALLEIESVGTGESVNIDSGGTLTISLTDIDNTVLAGVSGILGGSGEENQEAYRERIGEAHNTTPGIATPQSIKQSAKSIAGNTRVFVVRPNGESGGTAGQAGYKPELGETVVYVFRDNDSSIQPSAARLKETKDQIIADGHWPSFIDDDLLYVIAANLLEVDFFFTSITPNTVTMRNAIKAQLPAFFIDNGDQNSTLKLEDVNSFLKTIQDSSGAFLTDFTYSAPVGDISTSSGEFPVLGDVTFG